MFLNINNDKITKTQDETWYAGSIGYYEVNFVFSSSWNWLNKELVVSNKSTSTVIEIVDNRAFIPKMNNGLYLLGVRGYSLDEHDIKNYQISTNVIRKSIKQGSGEAPTQEISVEEATALEIYINQINQIVQGAENLDIDISKVDYEATITLTKKDGTIKTVTILDGLTTSVNNVQEIDGNISIDLDNIPDGQDRKIPMNLSELNNDINAVSDENYVHTDNNYTSQEKSKLEGLENYDDTIITDAIAMLDDLEQNDARNIVTLQGNIAEINADLDTKLDKQPLGGDSEKFLNEQNEYKSVKISQNFLDSFVTITTIDEFCESITNSEEALPGMSYMGALTCSGLPDGIGNAECKVNIISSALGGEVLALTLYSGNVAPFEWVGVYWNTFSGWTPLVEPIVNHARLTNLNYENSGHVGFASSNDLSLHNISDLAHADIRQTADEAKSIARGKAESRTFETTADLISWISNVENKNILKIGDNLYDKTSGVPDYWVTSVLEVPNEQGYYYGINPLDAEIPDISNMMTTDTAQTITGNKNFTGELKSNGIDVVTDISGKEDMSNKVTEITSTSTDIEYPSAKSVNDRVILAENTLNLRITELENLIGEISDSLDQINGEVV